LLAQPEQETIEVRRFTDASAVVGTDDDGSAIAGEFI
jgi:hypothetical protein